MKTVAASEHRKALNKIKRLEKHICSLRKENDILKVSSYIVNEQIKEFDKKYLRMLVIPAREKHKNN